MTDIQRIVCSNHSMTFRVPKIKSWVESLCVGKVLNLYAGETILEVDEIRNDIREIMPAEYHLPAIECVALFDDEYFDTIILDPPYSDRKSMEYYEGGKTAVSDFQRVKMSLPRILKQGGRIITLGYQSVVMGKKRGFEVTHVALFSHGGAIHDTVGTCEEKIK